MQNEIETNRIKQALSRMEIHPGKLTQLVWNLAGPHHKKTRQTVMEALTGERLPVAQCGVTAIVSQFAKKFGVEAVSWRVDKAIEIFAAVNKVHIANG